MIYTMYWVCGDQKLLKSSRFTIHAKLFKTATGVMKYIRTVIFSESSHYDVKHNPLTFPMHHFDYTIDSFFLINIKNYRPLHFEAYEQSKHVCEGQLSKKSQTKLNKGVLTPLFWVDIFVTDISRLQMSICIVRIKWFILKYLYLYVYNDMWTTCMLIYLSVGPCGLNF